MNAGTRSRPAVTQRPTEPANAASAAIRRTVSSLVSGSWLLWQGAGTVAASTKLRRARHRLRTLVSEHPRLYLPLARRKYPGPSPMVVGDRTSAVIDGYTRSASTFAVYAFQMAQREPVPLAHHLHASAQLKEAARKGLPTIMVIREPKGAVLSQVVREPDVDLLDALYAYRRFHASLLPYRESFVVADFNEVTRDFGAVATRLNERFGTAYGVFGNGPEQVAECHRLIEQRPTLAPVLLWFESGEVGIDEARAHLALAREQAVPGEPTWVPSPSREAAKTALEGRWSDPRLARAKAAADELYSAFVSRA